MTGCGEQLADMDSDSEEPTFSSKESPSSVTSISGETLFRGIMLGEGKVASEIPEISNLYAIDQTITDTESLEALHEFNDELIATIRNMKPRYFNSFRSAMTSGDQVAISSELQTANDVLLAATQEMPQVSRLMNHLEADSSLADQMLQEIPAETDFQDLNISKSEIKEMLYLIAAGKDLPEIIGNDTELYCLGTFAVGPVFMIGAFVHMYVQVTHSAFFGIQVAAALAYWVELALPESANGSSPSLTLEQIVNSIALQYADA